MCWVATQADRCHVLEVTLSMNLLCCRKALETSFIFLQRPKMGWWHLLKVQKKILQGNNDRFSQSHDGTCIETSQCYKECLLKKKKKNQAIVSCHRELNARSMGGQCLGKEYLGHWREGRHISKAISHLPCSDGVMTDRAI